MDIAGSAGTTLDERRSGFFARGDGCPGHGQHASDALLAQQRYTEALAKLEALSTEFSEEGQVRDLLVQACQAMKRAWVLTEVLAQCDQLRSTEQFDKALEVLDSALAACGAEPAILALRREVDEQRQVFQSAAAVRPVVEQDHRRTGRDEPALEALDEELKAGKTFQGEWQAAQVFFSGGQFQEAERILVRLAEDRPDVQALLETVRAARAASEEEQFYKRGRETALKLIQQNLFEQAADLLCNLLTLFPGDPILERDLRCAQGQQQGQQEDRHDDALAPSQEQREQDRWEEFHLCQKPPVRLAIQLVEPELRATAPANARWAVIAAAALFLLVAAGTAVWRFSRNEFPSISQTLAVLTRESLGPIHPRSPPRSEPPNAGRAVIPAQATTTVGDYQALRLLSGPAPVIPPLARVLGIHGNVNLEAAVDRRGTVTNVTFLSGQRLLISAATDAALRCRFQPATLNGQPLEVKIRILVTFEAGRT
jgi:TonB family protein